jgi:hypothetical protein
MGIRIPEDTIRKIDAFQKDHNLASRSAAILSLIVRGMPKSAATAELPPVGGRQDQASGAAANRWGHVTARQIAEILGAEETSTTSNEFELDGLPVTIRCASVGNNQVGLTNGMRDRVAFVVAAFQRREGHFELYRMTPAVWSGHANEASKGATVRGRLTYNNLARFRQFGESLGEIELADHD